MERLLNFIMLVIPGMVFGVVIYLAITLLAPYDDTDPPDGRSGMSLLTDHGTGCQYLYRSGAITPRMDANGKQMCSKIGG